LSLAAGCCGTADIVASSSWLSDLGAGASGRFARWRAAADCVVVLCNTWLPD
jgi:hypothetical protein